MLIENLTPDEWCLWETIYDPVALAECLFSNLNSLTEWKEDQFSHIRLYQQFFLGWDNFYDNDPNLSEKDNFRLRENAGKIINLSGRGIGKSLLSMEVDLLINFLIYDNKEVVFCSIDQPHVKKIMETVCLTIEGHWLLKEYEEKINRGTSYLVVGKNGFTLYGVNLNINSKSPGKNLFGFHVPKMYVDEASLLTDTVYKIMIGCKTEMGMVERLAGMTNFTKYMPAGRYYFYEPSNKNHVINLPQYVSSTWDEKQRKEELKRYGGQEEINWKIYVDGRVIESGVSAVNMEIVRDRCYREKHEVKFFEISRDNIGNFKNIIVLEKPKHADRIWVASDIGSEDTTEIIILFEVNNRFYYTYNITLHNLTDKEQEAIFDYIIQELNPNFVGMDATESLGRLLCRHAQDKYGKEHFIPVGFNEKLPVDFEKDAQGNTIYDKGEPVKKMEYVSEWSVKYLRDLLYGGEIKIPAEENYKFDSQFNSVVQVISGNRNLYRVIGSEDHLWSAFLVLAIMIWSERFHRIKAISNKPRFFGGV